MIGATTIPGNVFIPYALDVDRVTLERYEQLLKRWHEKHGLGHIIDRHTYSTLLQTALEGRCTELERALGEAPP